MAKSITSPPGSVFGSSEKEVSFLDGFNFDEDLEVDNPYDSFEVRNNSMVVRDLLNVESYSEDFISAQIDNLTLTFNVDVNDFDLFKSKLLLRKSESYYIKTENAFNINYGHCYFECNIAQNTLIKNNARLDFNPALVTEDLERFIINVILKNVSNVKITRLDIALDYSKDLSEYMLYPNSGLKQRLYKDGTGRLETLYLGSKQRLYRIYNKKKERLENAQEDLTMYQDYWRVEVQVRNQYLNRLNTLFEGFYLSNANIENLDLTHISNNMYAKIFLYIHGNSASNRLSPKQISEIKEVLKNNSKNTNIDLDNDYQMISKKLFESIEKYGVSV